jgi:hypothetical protein
MSGDRVSSTDLEVHFQKSEVSVLPNAARDFLGGLLWQSDPRAFIHA